MKDSVRIGIWQFYYSWHISPSELSCQSRGLYQSSACALCSCCAETSQSSAACHLTCETLRPSGWGMMYSTVITQGAPGHTTVPDDCQYTTDTDSSVLCLPPLAGMDVKLRVLRYTGPHRQEWGALIVIMRTALTAHFHVEHGNSNLWVVADHDSRRLHINGSWSYLKVINTFNT